ncbi:hypothetical protein, partial [Neobacillus drentensis]|uniref:hypothetical protein n=1 Tax=Neobacillus drentensis TaxID=220684 RepID=UPI003000BFB4
MRYKSKFILLGIMVIIIICLSTTYVLGKRDDNQYFIDYQNYQDAIKIIETRKGIEAYSILERLKLRHPNNEYITRYLGLASAQNGDFNFAASCFESSL